MAIHVHTCSYSGYSYDISYDKINYKLLCMVYIACENAEYARISSEGTQLSRKSAFKGDGRDTTESSLLANSDTSRVLSMAR